MAAVVDVFTVAAARQTEVVHEHVSRMDPFAIARVATATTAAAQVAPGLVPIARIVAPPRIVAIHAAPSWRLNERRNQGRAKVGERESRIRGDKTGTIVRGSGWSGVAPRPPITQ